MSLSQNITNAVLLSGGVRHTPVKNTPPQYKDRKRQYFSDETILFNQLQSRYSSDYVTAQVQGLDLDNPLKWQEKSIRLADIATDSAGATNKMDDYKSVLFADPSVDYVPIGSKIVTMGSTWLVTNPSNMSGATTTCIIQRCNATFRYYDFHGNVMSEPVGINRILEKASTGDYKNYELTPTGYFDVVAQYNDATKNIDTNSRLILGSNAYRVTGYSNFSQEFTDDDESVRLLEFTIRQDLPDYNSDDMENRIANGKTTFSWEINVSGKPDGKVGSTTQLTAVSVRNGNTVASTEEYPISYLWSSSDTSVAIVDKNGLVTGVGAGTATISCVLKQNEKISQIFDVKIEEAPYQTWVEFLSTVPDELHAYQSVTIQAGVFDEGVLTENVVAYSFSGADSGSYTATVDGNTLTVNCWHSSMEPLVITATYGESSATAEILLTGI